MGRFCRGVILAILTGLSRAVEVPPQGDMIIPPHRLNQLAIVAKSVDLPLGLGSCFVSVCCPAVKEDFQGVWLCELEGERKESGRKRDVASKPDLSLDDGLTRFRTLTSHVGESCYMVAITTALSPRPYCSPKQNIFLDLTMQVQ